MTTEELEYKCDKCDKVFDSNNEMIHTVEYNGCMDLCSKCYHKEFAECDNCNEDFYKYEIHRYNDDYWYCDECLNAVLHDENEAII